MEGRARQVLRGKRADGDGAQGFDGAGGVGGAVPGGGRCFRR